MRTLSSALNRRERRPLGPPQHPPRDLGRTGFPADFFGFAGGETPGLVGDFFVLVVHGQPFRRLSWSAGLDRLRSLCSLRQSNPFLG